MKFLAILFFALFVMLASGISLKARAAQGAQDFQDCVKQGCHDSACFQKYVENGYVCPNAGDKLEPGYNLGQTNYS